VSVNIPVHTYNLLNLPPDFDTDMIFRERNLSFAQVSSGVLTFYGSLALAPRTALSPLISGLRLESFIANCSLLTAHWAMAGKIMLVFLPENAEKEVSESITE
jgi:hypothetical protein